MAQKKYNYKKKAAEILALAEKSGVETNYFFRTTFDTYQQQMEILNALGDVIKELQKNDELIITKEYVKGKPNKLIHPAVTEYNKTSAAANKTVGTLLSIIRTFSNYSVADNAEKAEKDDAII